MSESDKEEKAGNNNDTNKAKKRPRLSDAMTRHHNFYLDESRILDHPDDQLQREVALDRDRSGQIQHPPIIPPTSGENDEI